MAEILYTNRLILRRLKESDAQYIFNNYATDEEVTKYLTWNVHDNVESTKALLDGWIKEDNSNYPNITRFGITIKGTDEVIGAIDLIKGNNDCEIGYVLCRKYRNQGIMSEALGRFLQYLKELGYKKVPIKARVENIASNKIIQKFGATFLRSEEIYLSLKNKTVKVNQYVFNL